MNRKDEVTFLKTGHLYDSYTDFWHLVELSGFKVMNVGDFRVNMDGIFITSPMNGDWRVHLDTQQNTARNCHLILWNLERAGGSDGSVRGYAKDCKQLIDERYIDEVWTADSKFADETGTRFVPIGSHPKLGQTNATHKKYNFAHFSYVVPRRETIYNQLPGMAPNGWGQQRTTTLMRSRFALNIHQDQFPFMEPLRLALFTAFALPILTESIYRLDPYRGEDLIQCNYFEIVDTAKKLLAEPYEIYKQMGLRNRNYITSNFCFEDNVLNALFTQGLRWR